MKESTFKKIWDKLLLPQVGKLLSDYSYLADFAFLNSHESVGKEYVDLKAYIKDNMRDNSDAQMDRHKVAAAFTMAIAKIPQFSIEQKKYNEGNLNPENRFEYLLKMNCNKAGCYIVDYVLAWKVGLDMLRCFVVKEEAEKGNSQYVSFLMGNGFSFPETSEKFAGSDYEVNAIRALYLTIPQYYVRFAERRAIFFLANMFSLIEHFTKAKYNLGQAVQSAK